MSFPPLFLFEVLLLNVPLCKSSVYMHGPDRGTWFWAVEWCREHQLELVSLHSDSHFQSLRLVLTDWNDNRDSYWIGLKHDGTDPRDQRTFSWSDGTPFDYGSDVEGGVSPWKRIGGMNPNSHIPSSCVRLQNNADPLWAWDDIDCNDTDNYSLQAIPLCTTADTKNRNTTSSTTATVTSAPSDAPTSAPTGIPSTDPSIEPTQTPSSEPIATSSPLTMNPTVKPTIIPTFEPTLFTTIPTTEMLSVSTTKTNSNSNPTISNMERSEDDEDENVLFFDSSTNIVLSTAIGILSCVVCLCEVGKMRGFLRRRQDKATTVTPRNEEELPSSPFAVDVVVESQW